MSALVQLKPSARKPKSPYGDDELILSTCAEWRAARAQQQKNWAEHERATMWGSLPDADIDLDTKPLGVMRELEDHLAVYWPHTILGARELLGVALTIANFANEDKHPEATLARGPVIEIIRNVKDALDSLKPEMRIPWIAARRFE